MNDILIFDIWGEYAHFRKYYTTTSPLTFSFPPRTTICGFIGAIIGLNKNEYLDHFSKAQAEIAIRILKPIKKVRIAENLIDTKRADLMSIIKGRTQIRFEFLKDVEYRIYFRHKNSDFQDQLKKLLNEHKCTYTPCLGLSEHIANFNLIGEVKGKCIENVPNNKSIPIDSVIPAPQDKEVVVDFEQDREYFAETMPIEMSNDRTVLEYSKVFFEKNANPISAKVDRYWELGNNERIIFL